MRPLKVIWTSVVTIFIGLALTCSAMAATCGTTTWDLTAGQTIKAGTVTVANDLNNIYVTYSINYPNASLGTVHMWVGNDLTLLPMARNGAPIPGQFPFISGSGGKASSFGLSTYTFTVPFTSLSLADAKAGCGASLYVVTHAEVTMDSDNDGIMDHETAFGGSVAGTGPRWWFYGAYSVCCDFGTPAQCYKSTAFAKGGWVFTTDRKSNPENLPSLNLIKNRWGWAVNLMPADVGMTRSYDIFAGAALNNITKGTKVGSLTVVWDGSNATVTYTMLYGYYLEEVHIYAGDDRPATTAPGQYGYPLEGYSVGRVETFGSTVPLADTNGVGGVWLIGHAIVTNGFCN